MVLKPGPSNSREAMTISSEPGCGPFCDKASPDSSDSGAAIRGSGTRVPRVLVIDQDRFVYSLYAECLHALGCEVVDGSKRTGAADFDLIVVDVNARGGHDADALRCLAHQHPATPILALSATFCPSIESGGEVARQLGVAAVLAKPFSCKVLIDTVRDLLAQVQ
jgi:CheY-like chemotaxis protein